MSNLQTRNQTSVREVCSTLPEVGSLIGRDYSKQVVDFIGSAKYKIYIIVYEWRWYPNKIESEIQIFNQAIIQARKRGVQVCALINQDETGEILKQQGIVVKKPLGNTLLHTKLMIIDDDIVILGSHNYTMSAFSLNQEASVYIRGYSSVKDYISYFINLWGV